jgi:hypothetical protein
MFFKYKLYIYTIGNYFEHVFLHIQPFYKESIIWFSFLLRRGYVKPTHKLKSNYHDNVWYGIA